MKNTEPKIQIERNVRRDAQSGRNIVRFTPIFQPDVSAQGELRFAFFESWEDEPDSFASQTLLALSNARTCLSRFAESVK